jgi:hypothetical protein
MAVINNLSVYKGEKVELNFGLSPAALTTSPVLAGAASVPVPTAGFPSSGTAYLLPSTPGAVVAAITYTGITAGALTGCANVPAVAQAGALVTTGSQDITGWNISLTLKRAATDAAALLTQAATIVSAIGGIYRVTLTKAQTNRQAFQYAYDVQRTDAGSEAVLSIGTFTVQQEVLNA